MVGELIEVRRKTSLRFLSGFSRTSLQAKPHACVTEFSREPAKIPRLRDGRPRRQKSGAVNVFPSPENLPRLFSKKPQNLVPKNAHFSIDTSKNGCV
jgi:hypothetical protein